jgi:hypothetical protein
VDLGGTPEPVLQEEGPAVPAPPAHAEVDVRHPQVAAGTPGHGNDADGVGGCLHGDLASVRGDRPGREAPHAEIPWLGPVFLEQPEPVGVHRALATAHDHSASRGGNDGGIGRAKLTEGDLPGKPGSDRHHAASGPTPSLPPFSSTRPSTESDPMSPES